MNQDFKRQFEVLGHRGLGYTEVRLLPSGKQYFSDSITDLQVYVSGTILTDDDVFVGINPRITKEGSNKDVPYLTCIVIDIDLLDGGTNEGAIEIGKTISSNLNSFVIVNSGSGCHVYIPLSPVTVEDHNIISKKIHFYVGDIALRNGFIETEVGNKWTNGKYLIDNIFDTARIIRCWGTTNSKNGKKCKIVEDKFNGYNEIVFKDIKQDIQKPQSESITYANGSRNQTLASLAGSMRRRGFSKTAIENALIEENKKCLPMLENEEVMRIAASIARYSPTAQEVKQTGRTISAEYIQGLRERRPGTYSGFKNLDAMTGGIKPGHMWIIAGRPGQGKTTFCVDLAKRYAKQNKTVLYFSTEMGSAALYDKIVSAETGVALKKFLVGGFEESDLQKIDSVKDYIMSLPIHVYEDFSLTSPVVEKAIKEISPEIVIIDQLQSFKYMNGGKPEEQGAVVQKVRQLSSDYGLKIILANQLNRSSEVGSLSLSNLKGTGTGEELADVVMFIVGLDKDSSPRPVDLHIMKSRYACSGIIRTYFHVDTGLFEEI